MKHSNVYRFPLLLLFAVIVAFAIEHLLDATRTIRMNEPPVVPSPLAPARAPDVWRNFYAERAHEGRKQPLCQASPSVANDQGWRALVRFSQPRSMIENLDLSETSPVLPKGEVVERRIVTLADFGEIRVAPYDGWRLVSAKEKWAAEGPCLGHCSGYRYGRFALHDKSMVLFTKIGDLPLDSGTPERLAQKFGVQLKVDADFDLPIFHTKESILLGNHCLLHGEPGSAVSDEVVTERGKLAEKDDLYGEFHAGDSIYALLPDGQRINYHYFPPADIDTMGGTSIDRYDCFSEYFDGSKNDRPMSPLHLVRMDPARLTPLKTLDRIGTLYVPKDKSDPAVQEAFKWYSSNVEVQVLAPLKPLNLDEYFARIPVFFWKDPFGRWIQYSNRALRLPEMTEPLLYVYSPENQLVRIQIDGPLRGIRAFPPVSEWTFRASATGMLSWATGQTRPYLFWEAHSPSIPEVKQGFLVNRNDTVDFLDWVLPRYGLAGREVIDFKSYWTPRLQRAPFYKISFLDSQIINQLAPLKIDPAPVTLIRVLMDTVALDSPIYVEAPQPPVVPKRSGLTVIEWGGIFR